MTETAATPRQPRQSPESRFALRKLVNLTNAASHFASEQYCYLTTTGRVTGRPHRIEIWFAIDQDTLYMLSGGGNRSDWVKNLRRKPTVTVEIGDAKLEGRARVVTDPAEAERARTLVHDKYAPEYRGDLSDWRRSALPIAVDLEGHASNR